MAGRKRIKTPLAPSNALYSLKGTATRLGLLDFAAVGKLGSMEEKREQMLGRCQEIYEGAHGKTYTNRGGVEIPDPDWPGMTRALDLACNLMGLVADANRKAQKPDDDERRTADIEQVAALLRTAGYSVEKAA